MKKKSVNNISAEVLAAFLDGNATTQEEQQILNGLGHDAELRELLRVAQSVDAELGVPLVEQLPMTAMAATCDENSYCCLECEKYLLQRFGVVFDEHELLCNAIRNGWQREEGTALHNVGRHLEGCGLVVVRRYKCTLADIAEALAAGEGVIVAVDGGELLGDSAAERREDTVVGPLPDHTVVVVALEGERITLYDPNSASATDTYATGQFEDAWRDSVNYLVTVKRKDMMDYNPQPIDLSDVELPEELNELREAIAENAHDVWAAERRAQGWTYGPVRDDAKRQTPCMVAYSQLPDSEKQFDRDMAINTIKLLRKLGYDIVKLER